MPNIARYGSDSAAGLGIGAGILQAIVGSILQQKKERSAQAQLDRLFSLEKAKTEASIAEPGAMRTWRTGEREATQKFEAGETDKARTFETSERTGKENFLSAENALDRISRETISTTTAGGRAGSRDYADEAIRKFASDYLMKMMGPKVSIEQVADILKGAPMGEDKMGYLNSVISGFSKQTQGSYTVEGLIQALEILKMLQVPSMEIPDQDAVNNMPSDQLLHLWDSLGFGNKK